MTISAWTGFWASLAASTLFLGLCTGCNRNQSASTSASAAPKAPASPVSNLRPTFLLGSVCGPEFEGLAVPAGGLDDASRAERALPRLQQLDLLDRICQKETTLQTLSFGIYTSAMLRFSEEEPAAGAPAAGDPGGALGLLRLAADDYANPLAQLRLARVYFKGGEAGGVGGEDLAVDLDRAAEYLDAAMGIAAAVRDHGAAGHAFLQPIVAGGLELLDALHTLERQHKYTPSPTVKARVDARIQRFMALYLAPGPFEGSRQPSVAVTWTDRPGLQSLSPERDLALGAACQTHRNCLSGLRCVGNRCRDRAADRVRQERLCRESLGCKVAGACGVHWTVGCEREGRCSHADKACWPTAPAHCEASLRCAQYGECAPRKDGRSCQATGAAHCKNAAVSCGVLGRCGFRESAPAGCVVDASTDCKETLGCSLLGDCQMVAGRCAPATDADCARSVFCKERGQCVAQQGRCVAPDKAACQASPWCRVVGACTLRRGLCLPALPPDGNCAASRGCAERGFCVADQSVCVASADPSCHLEGACERSQRCVALAGACVSLTRDPR